MTYRFVGDLHGHLNHFTRLIDGISDHIVALGDIGFGFGEVPLFPQHVRFIRGNHDDPAKARAHFNYLGDFGYNDGLFFLGGAFSIDSQWRIARMNAGLNHPIWWKDEELSWEDLNAAERLYVQTKPRVVISHEAPSCIGRRLLTIAGIRPEEMESIHSRTAQMLEQMLKQHQPEHWFFGHYHVDYDTSLLGTQFHCLNELSISEPVETARCNWLPGLLLPCPNTAKLVPGDEDATNLS